MKLKSFKDVELELAKYIPAVRELTGKDITLVRMQPLMKLLGNPEQKLKIIHIAGTSGKTSTAYYIASLLTVSGQKVGLTVSPHVSCINERVQINLEPLPEANFAEELGEFLEIIKNADPQPTYFELIVAFAYWYFAKVGVDYAVIETGLGGLHDASNIANSPDKVCVITDIGFDHMHVLGNKLTEIAGQKAGIIYPGNQVFMYGQSKEITRVFEQYSQKQQATLNVLSNISVEDENVKKSLGQMPDFQKRNWLLAYKVFEHLKNIDSTLSLTNDQLCKTTETLVPGRMQIFKKSDKQIILDGAHNSQKVEALVRSFKLKYPNQKIPVLVSLKEGKDYESVLPSLLPIASELIVTSYKTSQDLPIISMNPNELAGAAKKLGFSTVLVEPSYKRALEILLNSTSDILMVTGSFYLVSCLIPILEQET